MYRLYLIILGIAWISFYIWRFLLDRIPQNIVSPIIEQRILTLLISFILIINFTVVLIYYYRRLKNYKAMDNIIIKGLKKIVLEMYIKPLEFIYTRFIRQRGNMDKKIIAIGELLDKKISKVSDVKKLLIIAYYIPRITITLAIYIDIVMFQRFSLLYTVFSLIAIPLIYRGLLHIIECTAIEKREQLEESFITKKENLSANSVRLVVKDYRSNPNNVYSLWTLYYNIENTVKALYLLKQHGIRYTI